MKTFHYNSFNWEFNVYESEHLLEQSIKSYEKADEDQKNKFLTIVKDNVDLTISAIKWLYEDQKNAAPLNHNGNQLHGSLLFLNKFDPDFKYRDSKEIKELYEKGATLEFVHSPDMPPCISKLEKYRTGYYLDWCGGVEASTVKTKVVK